jgi:hypothetical protein
MFAGIPIVLQATDTEVFVCPASKTAAGIVTLINRTFTAADVSVDYFDVDSATLIPVVAAIPLQGGQQGRVKFPFALKAGSKIIARCTGINVLAIPVFKLSTVV